MNTASSPDIALTGPSGLDFPVVGVGASAGGLAAIKTLLQGLPAAPDMAFVVVLHLSPKHESSAAAILQQSTRMPVTQVTGPIKVERNHVYVIPPTHDLTMVDGSLALTQPDRPRGRQVVVDVFFRTLAEAHRERAFGIVLSGTGTDGSAGIGRIKEHGGVVFAQLPSDAEYDGMPLSAIASGHVDIVLPVADIPDRLIQIWNNARQIAMPDAERVLPSVHPTSAPIAAEEALREIMKTLHQRTGHDFKNYKRATVLRRLERRLQVHGLPDLVDYRTFFSKVPEESKALLDDLLIGVTQFFRDRAAFEALERDVLPGIVAAATDEAPIRAWVPGCSTGEEAYSLAMLLSEEVRRATPAPRATVFATDIDERAIATGRAGFYPEGITVDVPPARLRSWFASEPGGFRVANVLRETVIFAVHNVLRDPPFSRLDLVSCRNLLIYLDRSAQQHVLEMFHFALKPGGVLFLGTSETVDVAGRYFTPIDKANRIYRANPVNRPLRVLPGPHPYPDVAPAPSRPVSSTRGPTPADVHRQLLEDASPSVLVTSENEIVHVSGGAVRHLRFAEGEPSHNLVRTIRPELQQELRTALFQALQLHQRIDAPPVRLTSGGRDVSVQMSVRPVRHDTWPGEMMLVLFEESPAVEAAGTSPGAAQSPLIADLEEALKRRSRQLTASIEQYETSSEELKASNEELQAINEELRSATEELETSKEELQSTNEELITVNHELKTKIEETTEVNDDLNNLISSSGMATVFVDATMRIKRFTPAAADLFNLIHADVGRSLFDITHRLEYDDLAKDARAVFATLTTIDREIRSTDGRYLLARLLPYRTSEDRIGGAVLTFVDVTSLRLAEDTASLSEQQMALIADSMIDFAILTIDIDSKIAAWPAGARHIFGYSADEAVGQPFSMLFTDEDQVRGAPAAELQQAEREGRAPDERWMRRKDGSVFFASGETVRLKGERRGYAKICRDRTDMATTLELDARRLSDAEAGAEQAMRDSELKSEFLAVMSHELKHPLNLINVNAELLLALPEAQNSPRLQRAAATIRHTVQSQARIIEDLLDISRTNAGKLAVNRVPLLLAEAIQPSIAWALTEARSKGVKLYAEGLDTAIQIDGDPVRVEQIAWNLLSNALKFSRNGESINVRLSVDAEEAMLEVRDNGRGISPTFLPQIFDMFKQADLSSSRREGGLGIGLALVKNLVELHGGRVTAESEGLGRGATFRVWFPLHQRADFVPPVDAERTEPPRTVLGAQVLLVDDADDMLESFAFLLQHEGAIVTAARSGPEALEIIETGDFDLLISDVGMPGMDGYQLIAELRKKPRLAKLPAIALTGYGRPQDIERALHAGFNAHLDKPVDFPRMRNVIAAVLGAASRTGNGSDETN